jgi:hypothetical protein
MRKEAIEDSFQALPGFLLEQMKKTIKKTKSGCPSALIKSHTVMLLVEDTSLI